MKKIRSYEIKIRIIDKELDHLIKSLQKSGGRYSESLLPVILYQKEKQDKEYCASANETA